MEGKLLLVLFVVFQLDSNSGQMVYLGRCPALKPVSDFDMAKYSGTWFEYLKNRRYFIITDSGLRCATETYNLQDDGSYQVVNRGIHNFFRSQYVANGTARQSTTNVGRLLFDFPAIPTSPHNVPYEVLETDYDNYSVVWSCSSAGPINTQIIWVLTRERDPDTEIVKKALAVLNRSGFSRHPFIVTDQRNCTEPATS